MTGLPTLDAVCADLLAGGQRQADPGQHEALRRLDALLQCLRRPAPTGLLQRLRQRRAARAAPCRGLYLWGPVGRGKTWLMDQFCRLLPPGMARRLHFQHFMREVQAGLGALRHREQPLAVVARQVAQRGRVLCLDEFAVLDIGDAMILHGLLAGLTDEGVVLVTTSNTPPQRLYEGGLQRARFLPAIDLLLQHLDVVEIGAGPDYRLQALAAAGTWFDSARADTPAHMEKLFATLAGDATVEQEASLAVMGRRIQALRTAPGMAWFAFDALCEGPRGTEDYLALAAQLHTLFLSGIPVLDDTRNDATRRLVSLVDELYDQGVGFVASAAAEPWQLYRGRRLAQMFERTASRLVQMRGTDYLARGHQAPGGGRR